LRQIAPHARARSRTDFPLTPEEAAELDARVSNYEEVVPLIEAYGLQYPGDWAGVFVDQQNEGVVVAQFAGNVEFHAAAIARLVSPKSQISVRAVRWTLAGLRSLYDRIDVDKPWLATISTTLIGGGVDIAENAVVLRIFTDNVDAAALISDHFAAHDQLRVEIDSVGPWTGATGSLVISAVTPTGDPISDLDCVPIPSALGAYRGDTAWSTGADGTCRIPNVGATDYVIELRARAEGEDWAVVGRGLVTVPADGEGRVRIVVLPSPSP
jgi:hypothetical protein